VETIVSLKISPIGGFGLETILGEGREKKLLRDRRFSRLEEVDQRNATAELVLSPLSE